MIPAPKGSIWVINCVWAGKAVDARPPPYLLTHRPKHVVLLTSNLWTSCVLTYFNLLLHCYIHSGDASTKYILAYSDCAIRFRHIFISLTIFIGTPKPVSVLYKTSFLTESSSFLKFINNWFTALFYAHFFSSIWRMQNIWSTVVLLLRNPLRWSPIIPLHMALILIEGAE